MPAPGSVGDVPVGGTWVAICPAQGAHFVTLPVPSCGHPVHTAVLSMLALGLDVAVQSALPHGDPSLPLHGLLGPHVIISGQGLAPSCFACGVCRGRRRDAHSPRLPSRATLSGFAMPQSTGTSFLPLLAGLGAGAGRQQRREGGERAPGPRRTSAWLAPEREADVGTQWAGRGTRGPRAQQGACRSGAQTGKNTGLYLGVSEGSSGGAQAPGGPEGTARGGAESEGRSNYMTQGRKEEESPRVWGWLARTPSGSFPPDDFIGAHELCVGRLAVLCDPPAGCSGDIL